MKTACGYIRVSTEEQSREGVSLEMQTSKIKQYAALNDLALVGIYGDPGISGRTIKARPGIQAVVHLVKSRRIDALVTYKLDRLSRSTIETLQMVEDIDKAGAALHSITEKLDTQSAIGRFVVRTLASLAEMERDQISERTAAALAQKRAKGEKTGGHCPYGYCVGSDGKLQPCLEEQQTIKRMKTLRARGFSHDRIARKLSKDGIFTRKGTPFRETQIIRILKSAA